MANIRTHYDNLKVARNAPVSVIKAAYKALCQTYHPDKFQGSNKEAERIMKIVNASYVELIDPVKRAIHDVWIKNKEAETTEQQHYQRQDKRDTPKTEEPPPSTKANQQSYSTSTEKEQERRREKWNKAGEQWRNQKQDTQQEYTRPPRDFKWGFKFNDTKSNQQESNYHIMMRLIKEFIILFLGIGGLLIGVSILRDKTHGKKEGALIPNQLQTQPGQAKQTTPSITNSVKALSKRALDLYKQGQYAEALPLYQNLAKQGDADAEYSLGLMYTEGQGVQRDYQQAAHWYRKAAEQGYTAAQFNLGEMYFVGIGVQQDYQQAVQWHQKAAGQGFSFAQNRLGEMYSLGKGVQQDYLLAAQWYQKAAEQGVAIAQYNLGVMYAKGQGVSQDYQKSAQWCRKAAEQGLAKAELTLGEKYYKGSGVQQDYNQASYWYNKAAEQGDKDAIAALNELRRSLHQVVTATNQQTVPVINQPEQPLPQSGANNANFRDGVAPLKIRTSSAGGHHYFVKIVNLLNSQPIGAYFIRSGGTIDLKVPLGTYEIRYASGTKWYGLDYLFGSDTTYNKADSTFEFSFDGYQYSGYTIELIMQQNGNLSTSAIKPNQW